MKAHRLAKGGGPLGDHQIGIAERGCNEPDETSRASCAPLRTCRRIACGAGRIRATNGPPHFKYIQASAITS